MKGFTIDKNLIFVQNINHSVSFPSRAHSDLIEIENNSFWFKHRNEIIKKVIKRFPFEGDLVDIGGGTTDITIYSEGSIVHTAVLSLGGDHLTRDIAIGLRTPLAEAQEIKHKYGVAMTSMVDQNETIPVLSVGGRKTKTMQWSRQPAAGRRSVR